MSHLSTMTEQTVEEAIASVLHQMYVGTMNIVVVSVMQKARHTPLIEEGDVTEEVINDSIPAIDIAVSANNYMALMSASPNWSPNKPAGVYSEEDLWIVVDAQRSGTDLAIGTEA